MSLVWLNGALLPAEQARIDPADRGFTLGDGVFETIRADAGVPRHVARHLARLRDGAGVLRIALTMGDDTIVQALHQMAMGADCILRLTLTRGPAMRGVLPPPATAPTMLITAAPVPPALPPARVIVSALTRRNEYSPLSRIKSLNYADSVLARMEASEAGADDALLLNTQGDLAEGTAANVFLLIGDALVTPRVVDGALPGIARSLWLETQGVREARIGVDDLRRAAAGFLVSAVGLRRLAAIDDVTLNTDPVPYCIGLA